MDEPSDESEEESSEESQTEMCIEDMMVTRRGC